MKQHSNNRPATADYVYPVDATSVLMPVDVYLREVSSGMIEDSDGFGELVRDGQVALSGPFIYPSDFDRHIALDATHIGWTYN